MILKYLLKYLWICSLIYKRRNDMRLIEEGKWKKPWSIEVVCSEKECGAKLLVEEKDVKPVDYNSGYYTECMICEAQIKITDNSIPLRMKVILDKKRKYHDCD